MCQFEDVLLPYTVIKKPSVEFYLYIYCHGMGA